VLKSLYQTWLVHGRQPLLLHSREVSLTDANCNCALHKSLRGDRSFLVHGVVDARDGGQSLYLAFNTGPIANGRSLERFRLLADPLIAQIDLAFRRIAALKLPAAAPEQAIVAPQRDMRAREEGLLLLVSQGKSNAEISEILAISACTVKNHMQRIMKKLDAANRTEAVTKFRQVGSAATRPSQLAGN